MDNNNILNKRIKCRLIALIQRFGGPDVDDINPATRVNLDELLYHENVYSRDRVDDDVWMDYMSNEINRCIKCIVTNQWLCRRDHDKQCLCTQDVNCNKLGINQQLYLDFLCCKIVDYNNSSDGITSLDNSNNTYCDIKGQRLSTIKQRELDKNNILFRKMMKEWKKMYPDVEPEPKRDDRRKKHSVKSGLKRDVKHNNFVCEMC